MMRRAVAIGCERRASKRREEPPAIGEGSGERDAGVQREWVEGRSERVGGAVARPITRALLHGPWNSGSGGAQWGLLVRVCRSYSTLSYRAG